MLPSRCSVVLSLALSLAALPAWAATIPATLDPDKDGTIDLNEARAAGGALFDRLDRDHDGTLDISELRGRLGRRDFAGADPDRDGTLDKAEYFAVVEKSFRAANTDADQTIDARELGRANGRKLLKLLQ